MGSSEYLAMYKYMSSQSKPRCDGRFESCSISRVFAGLQPRLEEGGSWQCSADNSMSQRQIAAQCCNISFALLFPVYDVHLLPHSGPVAVVELAQHAASAGMATIWDCLSQAAEASRSTVGAA